MSTHLQLTPQYTHIPHWSCSLSSNTHTHTPRWHSKVSICHPSCLDLFMGNPARSKPAREHLVVYDAKMTTKMKSVMYVLRPGENLAHCEVIILRTAFLWGKYYSLATVGDVGMTNKTGRKIPSQLSVLLKSPTRHVHRTARSET